MKIYLPPDLPAKIAQLSPEAQKVAKRLVRAKIRRVMIAARRKAELAVGPAPTADVLPLLAEAAKHLRKKK